MWTNHAQNNFWFLNQRSCEITQWRTPENCASFLEFTSVKASKFERNLDTQILGEQQTATSYRVRLKSSLSILFRHSVYDAPKKVMWRRKMFLGHSPSHCDLVQFAGNSSWVTIAVRVKAVWSVGRSFGVGENGTNGGPALRYLLVSFS